MKPTRNRALEQPRYVQRDEDRKVIGHYANSQPYAQECVPADHPDLVQWEEERLAARRRPIPILERVARLEAQVATLLAERAKP